MLACIKQKKVSIYGRLYSCMIHLAKSKTNQVELKKKEKFLLKSQG